jgi:hypothetical protein
LQQKVQGLLAHLHCYETMAGAHWYCAAADVDKPGCTIVDFVFSTGMLRTAQLPYGARNQH